MRCRKCADPDAELQRGVRAAIAPGDNDRMGICRIGIADGALQCEESFSLIVPAEPVSASSGALFTFRTVTTTVALGEPPLPSEMA